MNRRTFLTSTLAIASQFFVILPAVGRGKVFEPNLAKLAEGKGWTVSNRTVSVIDAGAVKGVRFDEGRDETLPESAGLRSRSHGGTYRSLT